MDPITVIVAALVGGAAAGAKDVATEAIKDAYAGLKALVVRRFGQKADVADAVAKVEQKPDSKPRQEMLREELETAGAEHDPEVVKQAQALLDLLKKEGALSEAQYQITVSGSGAAAAGGGVAAGQGGVAAGTIHGGVTLGGARPKRREEDED